MTPINNISTSKIPVANTESWKLGKGFSEFKNVVSLGIERPHGAELLFSINSNIMFLSREKPQFLSIARCTISPTVNVHLRWHYK